MQQPLLKIDNKHQQTWCEEWMDCIIVSREETKVEEQVGKWIFGLFSWLIDGLVEAYVSGGGSEKGGLQAAHPSPSTLSSSSYWS